MSEGEGGGRARTWTRQETRGGGGGEREEEKVRVRDTVTTKFRITTPNYLPIESTTHTPKKYFSFNTMYSLYSFYPHPTKFNSVFDRILGGNCQVFRGVGS